jgi:putative DNA primase/helicase
MIADNGRERTLRENVPKELQQLDQWVMWRKEVRKGKPTKVPYQTSRKPADSTEPDTWTTFEATLETLNGGNHFDGVGFVFSPEDPYCGGDVDKATEVEARPWIERFDSYTESSPSGEGFHIICKAKVLKGTNRDEGELYSSGRFFTMTGDVVRDKPIREAQDAADEFYAYLRRHESSEATGEERTTSSPPMTDAEVVRLAESATNGHDFGAVYRGGGDFKSDSERDMSLASRLAFWTQDEAQIERIMRGSGCAREKWDKHRTYLRDTIKKAVESLTETYHPGGRQAKASQGPRRGGEASEGKPTDDELRDRFIEQHPDHTFGLGRWRQYDGGVWESTEDLGVKDLVCRVLEDAKAEKIRPNRTLLTSVLELTKARLAIADERWDADPDILVCANGALRLSSRELLPHSRGYYATSRVPYDYDPDATSGVWEKRVMGELIAQNLGFGAMRFFQEFAGYCLTVDTSQEIALWLHGRHGGGRSTILEGLRAMLGSRAGLLSLSDIERSSFALTNLPGKTLVTAMEQPGGFLRGGGVLNSIISGEPIQIDLKFRDPVEITPRAKIAWAMNELPRVGSPDDGLFRRVKILSIPEIPEKDRDPAVKEEVKASGAAILNWALEGLERLRGRGHFKIPEKVKTATDEFREDNDVVAAFLAEECRIGKGRSVRATSLYKAYKWWCERHGHHPLNDTNLGRDLRGRGFEKVRDSKGVRRLGLELIDDDYSPYEA